MARAPVLQGLATLWSIDAPPLAAADAVAVFGGGLEVRPFAAARYWREHRVPKVLVSAVRPSPSETLGAVPAHGELNRMVLLKLGVPDDAIAYFGEGRVSNTYEEAMALSAWARDAHAHAVIVPTESFSSRRVRWTLERAFAGTGISVQVTPLDSPNYTVADWWRHEQGVIAFQNEVLKYAYYRYKY